MIIEINIYIYIYNIDWIKLKEKKYLTRLHLLEILFKNKYLLFLKLNLNYIIHKKNYR
jgi:hypothetical protein